METTSLTISFTDRPQPESTSTSQTYPWMYDPNNAANVVNVLSDCDKWVLVPWRGFEFHKPAIAYRTQIMDQAYVELANRYKQAWDEYYRQQAEQLSNTKSPTQVNTKTYESPTFRLSLSTKGVSNTTVVSGYKSSSPYSRLTIYFSPDGGKGGSDGIGGGDEWGCNLIPWEVFYEGAAQWKWNIGYVYEQWKTNAQVNWLMDGSDEAFLPAPNVKYFCNLDDPTDPIPFYVHFDHTKTSKPFNEPYEIKDINECWETIITPTQTIEVKDLMRLWYEPNPINPIPVSGGRITTPPEFFPAQIRIKAVYMRLAIGYIPPSGIKDKFSTYEGGISLDITPFCNFVANPDDGLAGKLEVLPFNFTEVMNKEIKKAGNIPQALWEQNGLHTLEVINMGTVLYGTVYDDQERAKAENVQKSYTLSWYIPSLDKGEYLYRKRWGVYNAFDLENRGPIVYTKEVTTYGRIGIKAILDIYNPFNKDIIFAYYGNTSTNKDKMNSFGAGTDININVILVKIPNNSNRRITIYGDYRSLTEWQVFFETQETKAYPDLQRLTPDQVNALQENSYSFMHIPYAGMLIPNEAQQDNPSENMYPPLGNGIFPIGMPPYRFDPCGLHSGQRCYADIYAYTFTGDQEVFVGRKQCFLRIVSKECATEIAKGKTQGQVFAHIPPDIGSVWYHPQDPYRPYTPFMMLWSNLPLGGAVSTLCNHKDKTQTYNVGFAALQKLANGLIIKHIKYNSQGEPYISFMNFQSFGTFKVDETNSVEQQGDTTIYKRAALLQENSNRWYWNDGRNTPIEPSEGGSQYWIIKNIVADGTSPVMQALMVTKVVDGSDNSPIQCHIPNLPFAT